MIAQAKTDEAGFTLVEVLVAFAILAGVLIFCLQIFADGVNLLSSDRGRVKAVEIARLELARLETTWQLDPGTRTGTTDTISWRIVVEPLAGAETPPGFAVRPLRVRVFVSNPGVQLNDRPTLETILLGRIDGT